MWAPLAACREPVESYSRLLDVVYVKRTLHDCPSQMNENVFISNSNLMSDDELIWWH